MAYINQDVIDEIKYRNNIEDVVSGYVSLKRAGSNLLGLCPFHSEKTPSFTVFPSEGSFYCFGCGAGGDVITFIRRAESVDYVSALEILAKRAGITIDTKSTNEEKDAAEKRKRFLQMNKDAAQFFYTMLTDEKKGAQGREYFAKRGLSNSAIRHFGLGYSPGEWGALKEYMSKLGYKDYELTSGFLCGVSRKNGTAYDYFRNRVMFPIIDVKGDVVAFGGRVLDDSLPKYLNSSDTPVFKKSKTLFALNFAKKACSEQLILCEGYMDVIALHCAGFENAVATLGTAMTADHARMMKKYTKSVVISYDSDEAGQRAADKAFRLLSEVGLEARVIKMIGAKDPDEYIKKFGADRFRALLRSTMSEFDYRFDTIVKKYNTENLDERIKAIEESENLISAVNSAAQRDIYIQRVSDYFGVSSDAINSDIKRRIASRNKSYEREETKKIMTKAQGIGDRVNRDFIKNPAAASAEETIIGILLLHPEYISEAKKAGKEIKESDFFTELGKKVMSLIIEFSENGETVSEGKLGEFLSVEELGRVTEVKLKRSALTNNGIDVLYDCIKSLKTALCENDMSIEEIIRQKKKKSEDKK